MSKGKNVSSLREFVNKLNSDDQYREQFFENPSVFLEKETGINVGGFRTEVDSYVTKLKTVTPGPKFYLPGDLPSGGPEEVKKWVEEYTPCLV